jgi:hypothetical protein
MKPPFRTTMSNYVTQTGSSLFTKGTNHSAHSGKPSDEARIAEYEVGPYAASPTGR